MRTRTILLALALALALLPAGALASNRILVSGKLDAAQGYDFSCSLVNKSLVDVMVTLALKDANGDTYVDPVTFLPVTLTTTLASQEAAMLVASAPFVGSASLYCWADVPPESTTLMGTFLVRDAQDRATAASPLQEDVATTARTLDAQVQNIHTKVENLEPLPGAVTGLELNRSCILSAPGPGLAGDLTELCAAGKIATGGGCKSLSNGGDESLFSPWVNAAVVNPCDPHPVGWRCAWRNLSTTEENVERCVEVICVDDGGPTVLP